MSDTPNVVATSAVAVMGEYMATVIAERDATIAALRSAITSAERERDEARRERDHWLQGTHMLEAALRGVQGIVFDDGYHINVAVLQEERDEALHRAERSERVVEAARVQCEAHGVWVQCGCTSFHCLHFSTYQGKCAVTEGAVRALDPTPTTEGT